MSETNLNEEYTVPEEEISVEEVVAEESQKTGAATAALVFGILALITTLFIINYVFGLIGIICGIVFLVKKNRTKGKKRAITGLVLAILSVVISTSVWVGTYIYLTTTDLNTLLSDISNVVASATGGEINLEQQVVDAVNARIQTTVAEMPELKAVEQVLGKELNYDTIKEFVGEDLSVEKIQNFMGDGIDASKLNEVMENVNYEAVMESLDNELSYKKLEEKIGKDFTYDELMEYLSQYQN